MRFELFIATRYLRAKRRQAFIGIITGISIAGVAAGAEVTLYGTVRKPGVRKTWKSRRPIAERSPPNVARQ